MPTGWSVMGDFEQIVDTLESVSLLRRGCGELAAIQGAWRFVEKTDYLWSDSDAIVLSTTVWQLPYQTSDPAPAPGDRLIDGSGRCWRIDSAEPKAGASRRLCEAVETVLRLDRCQRIAIQQPVWGEGAEGPKVVDWKIRRSGVLAALEQIDSKIGQSPEEVVGVFRVGLLDNVEIELGDRIVDQRNAVYQVVSVARRSERDGLHTLQAEAVQSAA